MDRRGIGANGGPLLLDGRGRWSGGGCMEVVTSMRGESVVWAWLWMEKVVCKRVLEVGVRRDPCRTRGIIDEPRIEVALASV